MDDGVDVGTPPQDLAVQLVTHAWWDGAVQQFPGRGVERLLLAQDARFAFLLAPRAELSHESPHRAVERAGRSDPSQRYAVPTPRRSGGRERSRRISYPWPERAAETVPGRCDQAF